MSHRRAEQGFSLIELAIVLVIIGLLVGGVLMGRNLIRNADLQTIVTDFTQYKSAASQFQDKYLALPGDFNGATAMWGAADATLATCVVTASTGTTTCDGNGDGRIDIGATPVANNYYEEFAFWKHLENEGLIKGKYTGIQASASAWHTIGGQNAPAGQLDNGAWQIAYWGVGAGNPSIFDGSYGNRLQYGANVASSSPYGAIITPQEAWNIDTKIDDGKPAYGKVLTWKNTPFPNCATTDVSATAVYDLTKTTKGCALLFITGF